MIIAKNYRSVLNGFSWARKLSQLCWLSHWASFEIIILFFIYPCPYRYRYQRAIGGGLTPYT